MGRQGRQRRALHRPAQEEVVAAQQRVHRQHAQAQHHHRQPGAQRACRVRLPAQPQGQKRRQEHQRVHGVEGQGRQLGPGCFHHGGEQESQQCPGHAQVHRHLPEGAVLRRQRGQGDQPRQAAQVQGQPRAPVQQPRRQQDDLLGQHGRPDQPAQSIRAPPVQPFGGDQAPAPAQEHHPPEQHAHRRSRHNQDRVLHRPHPRPFPARITSYPPKHTPGERKSAGRKSCPPGAMGVMDQVSGSVIPAFFMQRFSQLPRR